jgi:hypothetical protein
MNLGVKQMSVQEALRNYLEKSCESIYETRLDAVMDVAMALQKSTDLSLSSIGRSLQGNVRIKHKIKKVDRLEGNEYLHQELDQLYMGLSGYVFSLISQDKTLPIVVDLCFVKDNKQIQMLSAEVASKGRSIPLYREVFSEGALKDRAVEFLENLSKCIPSDREVVIIMDAGFFEKWFKAIEAKQWYWICRTRTGKSLKFSGETEWKTVKDFITEIGVKTKTYGNVLLTKTHRHPCRIVTTRHIPKKKVKRTARNEKTRKICSGSYLKSAKEPWILATNLPSKYNATSVIKLYSKRMQIEESFRDVKSHQFGLCGRNIRTTNIDRWGVKMLLAAIAQIIFWVLGVVGHSQGLQRLFQANTVKDRKVFSYFTLGRFIIEYDKLSQLKMDYKKLPQIMQTELAREW